MLILNSLINLCKCIKWKLTEDNVNMVNILDYVFIFSDVLVKTMSFIFASCNVKSNG